MTITAFPGCTRPLKKTSVKPVVTDKRCSNSASQSKEAMDVSSVAILAANCCRVPFFDTRRTCPKQPVPSCGPSRYNASYVFFSSASPSETKTCPSSENSSPDPGSPSWSISPVYVSSAPVAEPSSPVERSSSVHHPSFSSHFSSSSHQPSEITASNSTPKPFQPVVDGVPVGTPSMPVSRHVAASSSSTSQSQSLSKYSCCSISTF
mmetsp:Transcript_11847/g.26937  ORF Transcript_11847/g.26937 Transcript_11847/m.26937 type:complete len:207 (-) Transcript_11847:176-796(-)